MSKSKVIEFSQPIHKTTTAESKVQQPCQVVSRSLEASLQSWEYLIWRLKGEGFDCLPDSPWSYIFRTLANCLRVCCSRPIIVVYPDNVWYCQAKRGSN